jgi:uncharacterized protein YhfF
MDIEQFGNFCRTTDWTSTRPIFECFHFELTEKWPTSCSAGPAAKEATCSSLRRLSWKASGRPDRGLQHRTDWMEIPHCVLRTTGVRVLPFKDCPLNLCGSKARRQPGILAQGPHRLFTEEGMALGYTFSEDMPVVFETLMLLIKTDVFPVLPFCRSETGCRQTQDT